MLLPLPSDRIFQGRLRDSELNVQRNGIPSIEEEKESCEG